MEDAGVSRVNKSLGLFLGLVWTFGVPDLGVRYIWRLTYALIVSLLYSGISGIPLYTMLTTTSPVRANDAGALASALLCGSICNHAITIVWATRGAKIVQKTILDLAKVDVVIGDFQDLKTNFTFRQGQVLWIGFFLLWCLTEVAINVLPDNGPSDEISLPIMSHHSIHLIRPIAFYLQILSFSILLSSIIFAIWQRFHRVNAALYKIGNAFDTTKKISPNRRVKYILVRNDQPRTTKFRVEKLVGDLDMLSGMHKCLCDITEELNGVFSTTLFLAFLSGLTSSLAYAYIMSVTANRTPHNTTILSIRGFTLFYSIARFWLIVWSCSRLVTEANKLGVLLHRINVSSEGFYFKLKELSVKHHQEKLKIVAGGVLPIDYSWFKVVFSTVTAYALLIYQQGVFSNDIIYH